jgi:hypothetical protein
MCVRPLTSLGGLHWGVSIMGFFQNGFQKTSIEKKWAFRMSHVKKDRSFWPVFRKRIQKETGGGGGVYLTL